MLSPTVPNPTQFNFAPGTVISSSQVNSDHYGIEMQIFALIANLNSCAWIPDAAVGAITAVSPLGVAETGCIAGQGTGATVTLSLSGVVPQANLPSVPAFSAMQSKANGATAGYAPPVYTAAGVGTASTEHFLRATVTASVSSAATQSAGVTVSLSGQGAFTSVATYQVTANYDLNGSSAPAGWTNDVTIICNRTSASSFTLYAENPSASTGTGSVNIDYIAAGY